MISGWHIVVLALGYVGALFALAWAGDRGKRGRAERRGRPLIYALSIAVYCTSWTFFGSVGLSAKSGYDFIPVYLGPLLMFLFGTPLILRIVRLSKSQNITSIADFLAARYGKSPSVAALVTVVVVAGTLPYIALQLKAITVSVETMLAQKALGSVVVGGMISFDAAFFVAMALAAFAILFGTRHIDATEHQDGLMFAIAADSVVKLVSFLAVGFFVVFFMFSGPGDLLAKVAERPGLVDLFGNGPNGGTWLTVTLLSFVCIILLPRQFHVTVVENYSEREVRRSAWLFPIYLVLINLFVVPIALAGLVLLPGPVFDADMYVLALPMQSGSTFLTILAFVGGLSAATAMVIVDSVALAIMISNGFIVPWLVGRQTTQQAAEDDVAIHLLRIRRFSIFAILLLGYGVNQTLGQVQGLAAIGLVSFAAIAQLAPAFFGGLVWRRATARGAIAGISAGSLIWFYTLVVPWIVTAGWLPGGILAEGPFGLGFLRPQALFYLQFEPLNHSVIWSLLANIGAYITFSLLRQPEPIERLQAHVFVIDDLPRQVPTPAFRLWRTTLTVADFQQTVGRYLGAERAERSFQAYAQSRNMVLRPDAEADVGVVKLTEHLLTSAIGAASARLVLSLLLKRGNVSSQSALKLLDDASEAIQYNRDLLQSALDQVRHGLSVFDKDMRLICWNRQFRELLQFPADLGRVGVPLELILRTCAESGHFGQGSVDQIVRDLMMKLAVTKEAFQQRIGVDGPIIEIRTAPMPQGGIVTTYSDITERVRAAEALASANETLERRVAERTVELLDVNKALEVAKSKADEASLDKTRFLAAASHDILQPLNAARLYASSLVERGLAHKDGEIAQKIDTSLEAVEEILGALLDISRLDAGRHEAEMAPVALADIFDQLRVEFEPMAREKGIGLRIVPTTAWAMSDRRLLRRVLQNLVSNALKYTDRGAVLVGVRRIGTSHVRVAVYDTGPGIPLAKQELIFKEFHRLQETAATVRGLGLGLSIVERICKLIDAPIGLASVPGRGSTFSVTLPCADRVPVVRPKIEAPHFASSVAGLRILCLDNEPGVLEGMASLLGQWGCEVRLAASADQAKTLLADEALRDWQADVVLADYHLDEGTGVEAIEALRKALGWDIPAIIITADRTPAVQREVRSREFGLLHKPLKAASLRSLLSRYALLRAAAE